MSAPHTDTHPSEPNTDTPWGAEHAEWIVRARRAAPLIDGIEYYAAVRAALIKAERQILIVGWELHSEIDLLRGDDAKHAAEHDALPVRLADLLLHLVNERPNLAVHILIWDAVSLFALERQHLPRMKRPWARHPRINLVWDEDVPDFASQHQKIVTVDDRIAFTGGMDLTKSRWDTHRHAPNDPKRRKPGLVPGGIAAPYHDAMIALDADAAATLGAWARERWRRATNQTLPTPHDQHPDTDEPPADPWPKELHPTFRDQRIALARTEPAFKQRQERRQVEHAFIDQIRQAQHLIYIETQYLAHTQIADALAERLREPDAPEVVLILPYGCPGRVQAMAMDPQRDRLLARLRDADAHQRFAAYWPTLAAGNTEEVFANSVYVHAKILIADDTLLRIGSANLNGRSMGLDTELDAFLWAEGDNADDTRSAITHLRQRLTAYLLHTSPEDLADAEEHHGSPIAAIEALRGGQRTLHPFDHRAPRFARDLRPPIELADPDRPLSDLDAQRLLDIIDEHHAVSAKLRSLYNRAVGAARANLAPLAAAAAVFALPTAATAALAPSAATIATPLALAAAVITAITLRKRLLQPEHTTADGNGG